MILRDKNGKRYTHRIGITMFLLALLFALGIYSCVIYGLYFTGEYILEEYMGESVIDTVDLFISSLQPTDFDDEVALDPEDEDNIFVNEKIKKAAGSIFVKYLYILKPDEEGKMKVIYSAKHEWTKRDRIKEDYVCKGLKYGFEEIQSGNLVYMMDDFDFGTYYMYTISDNPMYNSTMLYRPMYAGEDSDEIIGVVCADSNAAMIKFMTDTLVIGSILLTCLFVLFMLIIFVRINTKKIAKPINYLAKAANNEAKQEGKRLEKFSQLKIRSRSEIGYLAASMKEMEESINNLMDANENEAKERERISASLDIAAKIQESQLPLEFPQSKKFDVFATMKPAKEVAGDYYDVDMIDDDHLYLLVADVSDKGVPAAMFMAISKIHFNSLAHRYSSPAKILEEGNNILVKKNKIGMFVTVWIGILEISTGKMLCANAGHEYPLIKRKDGQYEVFKDNHGLFVATMPDVTYQDYEICFEKGDELTIYSDGAPEARNEDGEMLTLDRFNEYVQECFNESSVTMIQNINEKLAQYRGKAMQNDDITLMNFKYNA